VPWRLFVFYKTLSSELPMLTIGLVLYRLITFVYCYLIISISRVANDHHFLFC